MFGLGPAGGFVGITAVLTDGKENLVVLVAESISADEREEFDMTENRRCGC